MNTEVRGMQNPIGSTILRGRAAIEEVQALLTQLVQHDKDLAALSLRQPDVFTFIAEVSISIQEVVAIVQARRDDVVRLLENKGLQIRPDAEITITPGAVLEAI